MKIQSCTMTKTTMMSMLVKIETFELNQDWENKIVFVVSNNGKLLCTKKPSTNEYLLKCIRSFLRNVFFYVRSFKFGYRSVKGFYKYACMYICEREKIYADEEK